MNSKQNVVATSAELYRMAAAGEIELGHPERSRLSPDQLFALALTDRLALCRADLDRIRPVHRAHLALAEKIALAATDRQFIPADLLYTLFIGGYTELEQDELNRFTPTQRDEIARRQARDTSQRASLQVTP